MSVSNGLNVVLGVAIGIDVAVEHNVGIARVVVEVGGLVDACGTGKRIGKVTLALQPLAQFDEAALVGSEIEIVGAMEGMQDIEIVG